ncbi:unnamed protein product [Phytophthora fragariaefolia]|uniref:Unnamed protein product n=1 Tax=Phytophthora fragariaefolia TaxID=1490495 RepID=A0A9W6WVH3_9STRA|nr:unnamed protein product [Phytophthora fragariaefolia]
MEAYKVKKRQLEAKKQRREEQKEKLAALNLLDDDKKESEVEEEDDDDDGQESDSEASEDENKPVLGGKAVTKVMTFNDDFTQGKFGDVVTVTTSVGDLQSDSEDSGSDLAPSDDEEEESDKPKHPAFRQKKRKFEEPQLTLFQRIQQQRKGKALPSKRSKLKDARAARKAMMGKKGIGGAVTGKKRGPEDGASGGSAISKLNKKLKMKRSQGGANKRQKKR